MVRYCHKRNKYLVGTLTLHFKYIHTPMQIINIALQLENIYIIQCIFIAMSTDAYILCYVRKYWVI